MLKIYNTLTRKKEIFKSINENKINLFVCGPTVYNYAHLGHAKTYVQFDIIVKYLRSKGYNVNYLQNITDIDDKIIKRANEEKIDWKLLRLISPRITNENKDINRVLFLLHGDIKKLEDSRVKKAFVSKARLNLLRKIDAIVNKNIFNNPSCSHIWQMPVVLVPFGYDMQESIVLRPVESQEAMTVSFAQIPKEALHNITEEIKKLNKIDYIFYDITNKPPGTIEWE